MKFGIINRRPFPSYRSFLLVSLLLLLQINAASQNDNPSIIKVEVDRTKLALQCDPTVYKFSDHPCVTETSRVKVKTVVSNPKNRPVIFKYAVTGGRIVATGSEVIWDLSKTGPGTYEVFAAIDFGRGSSALVRAEKVTIEDVCCIDPPCTCPTVEIFGPRSVALGSETKIGVAIRGSEAIEYSYLWIVNGGEIVSGQGTAVISVKWGKKGPSTVKLELDGTHLCTSCVREFATDVEVKP